MAPIGNGASGLQVWRQRRPEALRRRPPSTTVSRHAMVLQAAPASDGGLCGLSAGGSAMCGAHSTRNGMDKPDGSLVRGRWLPGARTAT
ncbi:hypothetical protein GUJ93_ZPchr0009g1704 [Zizania palustris]|uniref:Uncharacterized protein n=1 Tax=Zizania palustris TaxID=103762 RepID=A0A8J5VKK7_ZIZPA|nr:hypothetical protein GUJ93_ZPchr0009g1704 [Zizania palustris]